MTEFAETAVLVDVMDDDHDAAPARLADFLPGELSTFYDQTSTMLDLIHEAQRPHHRPDRPEQPDRIE